VTDYCLWALQRCYERCETRFIEALWPRVSLIRDIDDDRVNSYGAYLTRKSLPPTESAIKKPADIGFAGQRPETHGMKPSFVHR
jgi:hypothetical protein